MGTALMVCSLPRMRVLHVTDTHLGMDRFFRGAPTGWRRSDDHLAAFLRCLAPAFAGEVDLVVHTGDVFDRSQPPPRAVAEAAEVFVELGRCVPTLVMPGNHDRHGLRGHFPNPIPGVTVIEEPTRVKLAGLAIAAVPFARDAAEWRIGAAKASGGGVDVLLAHQSFDGSRVPGFVFRPEPGKETVGLGDLPAGVPTVLNGHIHTAQELLLGSTRIVHGGSTERTAFVERWEPKGGLVWHADGGHLRRVDSEPRPMVSVRSERDLAAITEGTLVSLSREIAGPEFEAEALARGGWVAPWSAPRRQVGLFTPRA